MRQIHEQTLATRIQQLIEEAHPDTPGYTQNRVRHTLARNLSAWLVPAGGQKDLAD
jgi:hypothetical protein